MNCGTYRRHDRVVLAALLLLSTCASPSRAGPDVALSFNRDIRPILSDRCFVCHGPDSDNRQADLRLDNAEGAHQWAIVPGDPDSSEVLARVLTDDPDLQMPPSGSKKKPLTDAEIDLLRRWISAGAKYESHWAYIPPLRPTAPETRFDEWAQNDIDRFLAAGFESAGVAPSAEADRSTLARRLHFDLTGLPPSPDALAAFEANGNSLAYESLVDSLLASEAYGERMASWWFDLVRFANTVGYHGDQEHRITPYRDYVIKSFNDNLPFDQFTIEQVAGDLLPDATMWQKVASGYNRLLQTTHEGGAQNAEYLAKHLADRVRNLSETWLGASMGCAECHDHKFDPYTQEDFYSLGAFFADVDHYGSFESIARNTTPSERPPEMMAWTLPVYREIQSLDKKIADLEAKQAGLIDKDWPKRQAELVALKKERVDCQSRFVPTMITAATEPREIRVLPRGNWMDQSGEVVQPAVPHFLQQLDVGGRRASRLDLARWLVSRGNPLTARVVVNRLWYRYFGVGLSKTLIDMGSQGECPPNQELLDWLAVEFMESGWDVKHIVRLMVLSSAYRQSSAPRTDLDAVDPENRLVARQNRFRLDAEQIRDNALAVSGLLVMGVGGDNAYPYQPAKYYAPLNFPEREYKASTDDGQFRRATYVHWQRQYLHPWLLAFDAPTREECTAHRPISNTPSAALVLLDDPTFVEAARALAARALATDAASDAHRIDWAWRLVLGRSPLSEEIAPLQTLLANHRNHYAQHRDAAEALTAVGISARPKLDVAEWAAWTSVSRVLLNLSDTITRN